jgi:energy-coupling factor transporter ATP-binding protein EcfA2
MKKIEIHNFGPIKDVVIDIKPMLVIIGQQASGKSTIAKLVYFFETLSGDFFSRYYQSNLEYFNITKDLIFPIRSKFYEFFGSTFHLPDFEITYFYDKDKSLKLTLNKEKKIHAKFSDSFFNNHDDLNELRSYKKDLLKIKTELETIETKDNIPLRVTLQGQQLDKLHLFNDKINAMFNNNHNDSLFVIAGRNATVGYGVAFEDMFRQNLQNRIVEQGKRMFASNEQNIEETLMLDFMQRVIRMKQLFINNGNFQGMILSTQSVKKDKLLFAHKLITQILCGQYSPTSEYGERIVHGKQYVYLKNASSGQQEAIRILQDAFLGIFQGNNLFRIIEEPEAHLFPEAQKATIELLTLALNNKKENNLIITTHSPYTLTVINNLIYAAKVGLKNPQETEKIVYKDLWLPTERVSAYILGNGTAESIIDEELGEIKAEMIDNVSKIINQEYDQLYDIEYGTEQ